MPTEPTKKRMRLPAGLRRGDVSLRLEVELVRDREYGNKKARAILSTIIYGIDGDNKLAAVTDIPEKRFYAVGAGYDKIANAVMQAIDFVQKKALDAGVWLPLAPRYINSMSWYYLDQYFRSMFTDADVFVDQRERSNLCIYADCCGLRRRPKLGSYYNGNTGRRVYCLDEYCMQSLIRYDNAVLLCYSDKLKAEKQPKKALRKA